MAYQIKQTFYELVEIDAITTNDWFVVYECDADGNRLKAAMRGTVQECTLWLDNNQPGAAVSFSE